MGRRRSRPNALGVTRTPGGVWRRLYSATSTRRVMRRTTASSQPAALISAAVRSSSTYAFRMGRAPRRAAGSGRRAGRGAARPRGLREHRLGDDLPAGTVVDQAAQPVDGGLVHVLDDGEAAGRVAVERGVPDRHLALVPGGQHQPAELVRQRHQQHPPDAALQVLLGQVGSRPAKDGSSNSRKAAKAGSMAIVR